MPQPEVCSNGVDDDLDGLTDCLDPDCAADPVCTCDPIVAFTCSQGAGLEVNLGWINGESYDQVEVTRDGMLLAVLPGASSAYTDAAAPLGNRSYVVTGFCGGSQSSAICDVIVQVPSGYSFTAPVVSGEFDEVTGVGSISAALSIAEDIDNTGFPNDTQGFSMSLAHDSAILTSVSVDTSPLLAGINGSEGPDFLSATLLPGGVTVGVQLHGFRDDFLCSGHRDGCRQLRYQCRKSCGYHDSSLQRIELGKYHRYQLGRQPGGCEWCWIRSRTHRR